MINRMKVVLLVLLAAVPGVVHGAGFSLYEWSARGNAMGGAVLANKAEPASIAANPALITKLEGTQVQAGLMLINVSAKTEVDGEARKTEDKMFVVPDFYLTGKMSDNVYFGLGVFSRFGLGETYRDYEDWIGSISAYYSSLETLSVNPNIAVKINGDLSFAMGLEAMTLNFKEKKYMKASYIPTIPVASELFLQGDSISWGGNFAAYYNPSFAKEWAAALTYRTKVRHVAKGKVEGSNVFASAAGDASAALILPDSLSFGLSFTPTEKLVFEADIIGTFWSSYNKLKLDYDDDRQSNAEPKNYKNVARVQFGTEYSINKNWDIRAGYTFDKSPINENHMDTLVPAHDRNVFSAGAGFHKNKWGADISYTYLSAADFSGKGEIIGRNGQPREVKISYSDSSSSIIGINVKYAF